MRRTLLLLSNLMLLVVSACSGNGSSSDTGIPDAAELRSGETAGDAVTPPDTRRADAQGDAPADVPGEAHLETAAEALADALADAPGDSGTDAAPADVAVDIGPDGVPFSQGPYGINPFDTAGPFMVPTQDGDWVFEKKWSGGQDSYVFLLFAQGYAYSEEIWTSPVEDLLKNSPKNVHYFFLSYSASNAAADVHSIQVRFDAALAKLSAADQQHWAKRLHFVDTAAHKLGNWVSDVVNEHGYFAFCIDRKQQLRETGMLSDITSDNKGKIRNLAYEVEHFNFEWDLEAKLAAEQDVTVVPLFVDQTFGGNGYAEVELPSAETMAEFDTLEIDLSMGCPGKTDFNCGDWDYLAFMFLCAVDNPELCEVEIGRWITGYKRQGRWVTDVSPALAFMQEGGKRRIRYDASGQTYLMNVSLRFMNKGSGMHPTSAIKLWGGGPFYQDYNKGKTPVTFQLPPNTKKTQLFSFITGHGFGNDLANCAEFCNHTHHFSVNGGKEYVKKHPEAGTGTGCAIKVPQGVIPNQFGTWPFGRGGWCPGWDVAPFMPDVTADTKPGENVITYKALYYGKDYEPKPAPKPNGFGANINMSSWLVFWE